MLANGEPPCLFARDSFQSKSEIAIQGVMLFSFEPPDCKRIDLEGR
jgi:hypothetical protein